MVTCISCPLKAPCGHPSIYITDVGGAHALWNSLSSSVCKHLLFSLVSVLECKIKLTLYFTEISLWADINWLTQQEVLVSWQRFGPRLLEPAVALTAWSTTTKGLSPLGNIVRGPRLHKSLGLLVPVTFCVGQTQYVDRVGSCGCPPSVTGQNEVPLNTAWNGWEEAGPRLRIHFSCCHISSLVIVSLTLELFSATRFLNGNVAELWSHNLSRKSC